MFIDVDYSYSDNIDSIKDIINNLPNIIACDFEAANKLTEEQMLYGIREVLEDISDMEESYA